MYMQFLCNRPDCRNANVVLVYLLVWGSLAPRLFLWAQPQYEATLDLRTYSQAMYRRTRECFLLCMAGLLCGVMGVKAIEWLVMMITLLFCREEVDALARRLRLKLFRTSVKENFNVEQGRWGSEKGRKGSGVEKKDGWG